MSKLPKYTLFHSPGWQEYALLDSGEGRKLERFGKYVLDRPEPEALWKRSMDMELWNTANAVFSSTSEEHGGHWEYRTKLPEKWPLKYQGYGCWVQLSGSRHVGIFPEQAAQWDWIEAQIREHDRQLNVLNLFGYTGMASLAAARGGAKVTHLDASKKAIQWAKANQQLSGMESKPIRWIVDDALKFVRRENRRGVQYDGIILDPPKFGRGPKGEIWEFYKLIPNLLDACRGVLSKDPVFISLTAYAVKASPITLNNAVEEMMANYKGKNTAGEIILRESNKKERVLPKAIFCNWSQ
ncbi:MAG: class I SAM-dependent methyltransferase [Anaerolineaceae bacterium]|nr:class I SAM-dependent methyltransferase [Anaerolineaceae bacterium]